MFKYKIQLEKLIVSPKEKEGKTIPFSFISEEDNLLGSLFIIGEINAFPKKKEKPQQALNELINFLIESIRKNYFDQPSCPTPEEPLEKTLEKVNEEWQENLTKNSEILEEIDFKRILQTLHLVVGAVKENNISFSRLGIAHALLIRENKIVDIFSSSEENNKINIFKPFSNIVSGKLKNNEIIFFCFDNFLDYFSLEKIKRILQEYQPDKAASYLQSLIQPIESSRSFSAIILKITPQKKTIPKTIHLPVQAEDSLSQLILKQKETEKFIHPSPIPSFRFPFKKIVNQIKSLKEKKESKKIKKEIKKVKSQLLSLINSIKRKKITSFIGEQVISLNNKIVSRFPRIKKINIKLPQWKIKAKLVKIPRHNRTYFVGAVTIAIILILGISISLLYQSHQKKIRYYHQVINEIKEKQTLISSALIYRNEKKAKALLSEVNKLLQEIPSNKSRWQSIYEELSEKNEQQLNQVRHLVKLENPFLLVNLETKETNFQPNHLLVFKDNLYFWQGYNLYQINLRDKKIKKIAHSPSDQGNLKLADVFDENSLIFFTDKQNFLKYDLKEKSFSPLNVETKHHLGEVKDIEIYANRLYLLDKTNNQIYKYLQLKNGLGKETTWLKDKINLQETVNLAIDSNIWLAKSNGEIVKLYLGKKQNWQAKIDPPLNSINKIYTKLDYNYLYIIDAKSKRVIILDKNGKLYQQFESDKFDDLKDIIVDEPAGKIYLLNKAKIYLIQFK